MTAKPRFPWLSERIPGTDPCRIAVINDARPMGKRTHARAIYPELRYVHLDAVDPRSALSMARITAWADSTVSPQSRMKGSSH